VLSRPLADNFAVVRRQKCSRQEVVVYKLSWQKGERKRERERERKKGE
jgi:hypothetical protein